MYDIEQINGYEIIGYEIINFLNSKEDEFCDVSCSGPFTFQSQKTQDGKYELTFSAPYNNLGKIDLTKE